MKKISISICLILSTLAAHAGQETQNGGGAAEQNFAYALMILKPLYQQCLTTAICLQNDDHRSLLKSITENLDQETRQSTLLRFVKGTPQFLIDGQMRVAYTGLTPGSPIYINRDMIYRKSQGQNLPFAVSEAVGVLTHELGHHTGLKDRHDLLDDLGGRLRAFFEMKNERVVKDNFYHPFGSNEISMTIFHGEPADNRGTGQSWLWLNLNDQVFNINDELSEKLYCPTPSDELEPRKLLSFRFGRLYWGDEELRTKIEPSQIAMPLHAHVLMKCRIKTKNGRYLTVILLHRVTLKFLFIRQDWYTLNYVGNAMTVEAEPFPM